MKNNIAKNLKEKMDIYHATILDIQKDKEGNDLYVFIKDQRSLEINYDKEKLDSIDTNDYTFELAEETIRPSFNGYIDLFIANNDTIESRYPSFKGFPFMCAKFNYDYVEIVDMVVVDDFIKSDYARKGYGTILINCLEKLCKKYDIPEIRATLTSVDATTEETKNRRNEFYKSNGFTLNFDDENHIMGTINKKIDIDV